MQTPQTGIVAFGQKTRAVSTSALDRVNVARLVAFMRLQLDKIVRQFLFEPNDKITRDEVKGVVDSFCNDLIAKRALFDYLVVCDETNNTPDRIDRNELYVDIAIEPVKAIEFIYIPIRIKNTGEIGA
jgi:phage tail sheath protein FI